MAFLLVIVFIVLRFGPRRFILFLMRRCVTLASQRTFKISMPRCGGASLGGVSAMMATMISMCRTICEPSSTCSVSSSAPAIPRNATSIPLGPHRHVGNIFIVLCVDHPFKFSWEINRMLRELRLEYMGQTTIVPDIPAVRRQLWRVRHVVRIDMLDLDEAKALAGIPEHITFTDLNSQISPSFGRGKAYSNPGLRSKANFMKLRRIRLRDILHRDQLEKELLEERRQALIEEGKKDPSLS